MLRRYCLSNWRLPNWVVLATVLGVLVGCSAIEEEEHVYIERSMDRIYNSALDLLKQREYKAAAAEFDEVERQHPYSSWATKAQLMSAYAYYSGNAYPEAISGLERFIQLHPAHKDTPYAYYLKGLSYYEQISDVGRDQRMTTMALKSLREIVARFPKTKYARDSKLKIDLTVDHLAGKEMNIGRYYQDRKQYLAAINRFKLVTEKFQRTTHVPEALHRLVEAYLALGLRHEAKKVAAVLGHNYPGNEWYSDTYDLMGGSVTAEVVKPKKPTKSTKPKKPAKPKKDEKELSKPWYILW
ncbi:MAG: outer membrane protein assembly factor BamD [Rhodospirillaceae bacterium]|jgi:outer membrane protein assembly factor BamD|nr:outer membrane protein assembly factor BamD [Rhodospirillaceae bacterium]MBT7486128.1 outer membrane protein assembly factor BamD [Rhodospirillales bacterium]MBT4700628.1 outer membrane protein assembly factor BamD [Rhodospirillaceae bacterium]MBT5036615.1 outer membrane protein assembly factor BamD [Rhodospirillaceae bacterium]MBT6221303.1 outer membrane protein assembly factor BamD [Rhodospirillaceae bacterium]